MDDTAENKFNYLFAILLGVAGLLIILIFVTLSSQADEDTGTASSTISNTAPVISNLALASANLAGGTFTPSEAPANDSSDTTVDFTVSFDYTDDNGCTEVEDSGSFYARIGHDDLAGTCQSGSDDGHDCYEEDDLSAGTYTCSDSCTGGSDTTGSVSCTFPLNHFTKSGAYTVEVNTTDGSAASDTASTTFSVASLAALTLPQSNLILNNGTSQAVGTTSTVTTNANSLYLRNGGNADLTSLLAKATDFSCSTRGTIAATNLRLATSSLAYESMAFSAATTNASLGTSITAQTVAGTEQLQYVYGTLNTPSAGGYAGTCTSTVTITAS